MGGDGAWISRRLWEFVSSASADAAFARELRVNPRLALARCGLPWDGVPGELPLPERPISANLSHDTLFGAAGVSSGRCPAAGRLEATLCLLRAKPMLLDHGPEAYAAASVCWYRSRGMVSLLSPYEFVPLTDVSKAGYSNAMSEVRPARAGSGAWRTVLAGWEEDRVLLGWLCLLFGWDEFLGSLLGYPACCAATFPDRWEKASAAEGGDVAPLILREIGGQGFAGTFGWETNVFARYFGAEIIQHFPCRLDCPRTATLARRNFAAWHAVEPERAGEVRNLLGSPVIYARGAGIALLPGAEVTAGSGEARLAFDPKRALVTAPQGTLREFLDHSGGRIIASRELLRTGREVLEASLVNFSQCSRLPATQARAAAER